MKIFILFLLICLFGLSSFAQELQTKNTLKLTTGQTGAPAKIADMAWRAATWRGKQAVAAELHSLTAHGLPAFH